MAESPPGGTNATDETLDTGEMATPVGAGCLSCGTLTIGQYCRSCGYEVNAPAKPRVGWPAVGDSVGAVELRAPLLASPDTRRFLAADKDGQRFEVLVTSSAEDPALLRRRAARKALGPMALVARPAIEVEGLHYELTPLPDAPSLAGGLTAILADRDIGDTLALVRRWAIPVIRALAELHRGGLFLGGVDPAELLIGAGGQVTFRDPPTCYPIADGPLPPGVRRAVKGFSPPEMHGRCGGWVDPRSDVFFAGLALYYVLARIPPLAEAAEAAERLPPPHIYQPSAPPELTAIARRATSPVAARRYEHAGQVLEALELAMATARRRRVARPGPITVDIGHERHIGVLKGQYSPQNQDDIFLAYHAESAVGLFVVADGVSISEHGSGDIASGCVRQEALNAWRAIVEGRIDGDEVDDETLRALGGLNPVLPESYEGRRRILQRMLDAANARIGRAVHQRIPRFLGPPEGIMASTTVAVLLEDNHLTLASIGDSRIYHIRDGHMASLMVDHDLATQLMRMGRPPSVARGVPAAGALIRCVGEFDKDGDDRLVPVPLQPELRDIDVLPGDTILLTSDGIPDYSGLDAEDAERRMLGVVQSAPGSTWAAFELMVLANHGGGGDNISCIVLRFFEGGGAF